MKDLPLVHNINRNACIGLERLADEWKSLAKPYPPLVVRVLHRARLMYYGKATKTDKWPYQVCRSIMSHLNLCTYVCEYGCGGILPV